MTSFKPITDTLPKALVPVAGKPLLYHVVSKLKEAGISDFVINVHHFADSIIGYTHEQNDFGVKVSFSDERDLLRETGGGIKFARPLLPPRKSSLSSTGFSQCQVPYGSPLS